MTSILTAIKTEHTIKWKVPATELLIDGNYAVLFFAEYGVFLKRPSSAHLLK